MNALKFKLDRLNFLLNNSKQSMHVIEDTYALSSLRNLLDGRPLIPITEKSFRPFGLQFLVNEIIVNQRRSIVEFGAGISTIVMARLFSSHSLNGKIVSVEHNQDWIAIIQNILSNEGLQEFVEFQHAPLKPYTIGNQSFPWYDKGDLHLNDMKFDLLLVDGPPSNSKAIAESRYFALPFVINSLADRCVIMLDDAQRWGEMRVLNYWKKEFKLAFTVYSETLGVAYKGNYFVSNPLKANES